MQEGELQRDEMTIAKPGAPRIGPAIATQVVFGAEARARMVEGADILSNAVKATLGPGGRNVVLARPFKPPVMTRDGVLVAREIELQDPMQNSGARLVREMIVKTRDMAGDGTTTATVLAQAILAQGMQRVAEGANPAGLKRGIDLAVAALVKELEKASRPTATTREIAQVGAISARGDDGIGRLIADAMDKVGRDGAITVVDGRSLDSELDVVEGMQFDRGYLSPYFVDAVDKQSAILDNPFVLLFDRKIGRLMDLVPVLEQVAKSGRPLLIVAEDVEGEALAGLVVNVVRGILKAVAVKAPGFGDRRDAMLEDIAILTGGRVVSESGSLTLGTVTLADLGQARRIEVGKDSTTVVGGAGPTADIEARVRQIRAQCEETTSDYDREKLMERLAKLASGVAVIKVGAATEAELKEKKARIEDALQAVRAAVEEGVVAGGGVALLRARQALGNSLRSDNADQNAGIQIVFRAIEAPLRAIVSNAGGEASVVVNAVLAGERNFGFDAAAGNYGDLLELGVLDPTKVTRTALQNAASAASLVLTTEALISDAPGPPAIAIEGAPAARGGADAGAGNGGNRGGDHGNGGGHGGDGDGNHAGGTATVFPRMALDDEHPLAKTALKLKVWLDFTPSPQTAGRVSIDYPSPKAILQIDVHLLIADYATSKWEGLSFSMAEGTLKPAEFTFETRRPSNGSRALLELRANFYLNGRWCGEGRCTADVRADDEVPPLSSLPRPAEPEESDGLQIDPRARPCDLLVRIQRTGEGIYAWSCSSPHMVIKAPAKAADRRSDFGKKAQTYARELFWRLATKPLQQQDVREVQGVGEEIYRATATAFKEAYWAVRRAATEGRFRFETIQFITDEPFVPWELMRIVDDERGPEDEPAFLFDLHRAGRWFAHASTRLSQRIQVGRLAVAASDYDGLDMAEKLPHALAERDHLTVRYAALQIALRSDSLLGFLESRQAQALHLACHGRMNTLSPLASELILEDDPNNLRPPMVDRTEVRRNFGRERPLVFLNACEAGASSESLSLVAGFPAAFISAGASAVVCPLWIVKDEQARSVCELFYARAFAADAPELGEVMQHIRSQWSDKGHLTYLSYVLYGDPRARVVFKPAT